MSGGAALSIINSNNQLIHRNAMRQASEQVVEVHEPEPFEPAYLVTESHCLRGDAGVPTWLLVACFTAVIMASVMITAALVKAFFDEWKEQQK